MLSRRMGALLGAAGVAAAVTGVSAFQASTGQRGVDVPAAVRAAVEKFFGAGGSHDPQKQTADGAVVWLVSGSKGGQPTTLTLSGLGEIQEIAQPVSFRDLPAAVQAKLRTAYPKAKFERVESLEMKLFRVNVRGEDRAQDIYICAAGNRFGQPGAAVPGLPEEEWDADDPD